MLAFVLFTFGALAADTKVPGALYAVFSPGSYEASYILGTTHDPVAYSRFPGDVEKLIRGSKSVSVERVSREADLKGYAQDPMGTMAKLAPANQGGTPLDANTRRTLLAAGLPTSVVDRMKDEHCTAISLLTSTHELPLDLKVQETAYANKVKLVELDTEEIRERARREQAVLMPGASCSLKAEIAKHGIKKLVEMARTDTENQRQSYLEGAIDYDGADLPIVTSRNLAWLPKMRDQIDGGRAFIAVGQTHLYGTNGLLAQLQRRGYQVLPVMEAPPVNAYSNPYAGAAR